MLNLTELKNSEINTKPYSYIILKNFINNQALTNARRDYPVVPGPGSHPPNVLKIHGGFDLLMKELLGSDFRKVIESKFEVNLKEYPLMYTVRGYCRAKDGKIHTDSKKKVITVLLYMNNDNWPSNNGRLRLLNNGTDLEDFFDEVEPKGGTLLIFKRSDISWHGHHSFEGKRRAIQLNWVLDDSVVEREQGRHEFSSRLKKLFKK